MRYRLIATDIDGTLLNNRLEATPRTRRALSQLRELGVTVVLSTARPPRTVADLYRDLGLDGPVIAYNGALVYVPGAEEPIVHHPIPRDVALGVLGKIREVDPSLNCGLELRDEWHRDRIDDDLDARIWAAQSPVVPQAGDLEAAIASTRRGVSKIYTVTTPDIRAALEQELAGFGVSITSSGWGMVEILAPGVHKGRALRELAARMSIPLEATLAQGDGENDIPALQAAGLGIAMGNALDAVKRAAHVVAGRNDEDGWAEAVERYVMAG